MTVMFLGLVAAALACEPPTREAYLEARELMPPANAAAELDAMAANVSCADGIVPTRLMADIRFCASVLWREADDAAKADERALQGHVLTGGRYVPEACPAGPAPTDIATGTFLAHESVVVDGVAHAANDEWSAWLGEHYVQGLGADPNAGRWMTLADKPVELGTPCGGGPPRARPALLAAGGATFVVGLGATIAGRLLAHDIGKVDAEFGKRAVDQDKWASRPLIEPLIYGGATVTAVGGGLIVFGLPL